MFGLIIIDPGTPPEVCPIEECIPFLLPCLLDEDMPWLFKELAPYEVPAVLPLPL